ncbi:hypothetical protein Mycsm_02037 [Mycobacterium sp. JS623]|uniref:hypothetical protein n=1 Tax=Mycobacterium sp. JS623 TaxID=212767 RepID=UPI0002A551ED|nr:hypothetical protein [Mycobacterium sp. JS623]AGB22401.1 hypothetical protein Mycsm_02037 [Mycobacterium sp. JS623]
MSTARTRARYGRGALVGVCSAVISAAAHGLAGGEVPTGASLTMVIVLCAVAGAIASSVAVDRRGLQVGYLIAALLGGQLLAHLAMTVAACHPPIGPLLSASMLGAHAAGALVCALPIGAAEHLYVVLASVLAWLTVFSVFRPRTAARGRVRWANPPVLQPLLLQSGRGTRSPPWAAGLTY